MSSSTSSSSAAQAARRAKRPVPPSRRTQADRRETAEHRLLDAAIRLIAKRGIKGATLGAVGEGAGYSSGLTAHHFKTKGGLIKAVTAEIHRRFRQAMSAAAQPGEGLQRLLATIDIYFLVSAVATSRTLLLIQKEALTQQSEFRGVLRKFNRLAVDGIAAQIRIGIERGEIRPDIDVLAQATLMLAALRGARAQWLQAPDKVDRAAVAEELKAHVKRALGAMP
jgi:AcrR family transcriptional regulator